MRGLPALLLLVLLIAPSVGAQESLPPRGSVWTVHTTVQADVRDNYAVVKVIESIANRGPDPEFPFVVRIPDDAFVTGLLIERDGSVFEAIVKDREAARAEYEAWKAQEQTGGLVEKARHTSIYSYLINVAEFTDVRATLTYERYLAADRGVYDLSLEAPVSGFGEDTGARFEVTVHDSDGVVVLWGDPAGRVSGSTITHEVGPRGREDAPTPFTASYSLAPTADAGSLLTTVVDGRGYFAHRFRAQDDAPQLPMDLVLVLDVSGSMAGLKMQQMLDAAKQVVASLSEEDRLHLVAFSSDSYSLWSGLRAMTPESRREAARAIDALFQNGGTNIEAGLSRGFAAMDLLDVTAREERFAALVLLTDGQPTSGITSREGLLALERDANDRDVPVFGIAFGDDADWGLIRALAAAGNGASVRVPLGQGAEVDLRRFMGALTTPVLRDVRIEYGPGVEAFRPGAPVLFAGSELLVVGTFDPAQGVSGVVTGVSRGGERRYTFEGGAPATLPFLPRLVAYHQVRALQEADEPDVAAIKALALRHSFVTDHTSLVLTLPEDRPGVDTTMALRDEAGCADCWSMAQADSSSPSAVPLASRTAPTTPGRMDVTGATGQESSTADAPPAASGGGEARAPGPGLALVLLGLVAVALLARRRG